MIPVSSIGRRVESPTATAAKTVLDEDGEIDREHFRYGVM